MPIQKETLEDNINHYLIETGTYIGIRSKLTKNNGYD